MNLTPEQFLTKVAEGVKLSTLNYIESPKTTEEYKTTKIRKSHRTNRMSLPLLVKHNGFTPDQATEFLNTDFRRGFTICRTCGTSNKPQLAHLKHLSYLCRNCDANKDHYSSIVYNRPRGRGSLERYNVVDYFLDIDRNDVVEELQIGKYKDLVKTLFAPIIIEKHWLSRDVVSITKEVKEELGDWQKELPVLADALEDAGCYHVEILAILRSPMLVLDSVKYYYPVRLLHEYIQENNL